MEEELKCKKCNSSQTRFRLKTKDIVCNKCGYILESNREDKINGGS